MDVTLSDDHELQVQGYLRFAKLKRDQHVRETLSVIRDFKQEHLHPGEMYNFKEISGLLGSMEEEVRTLVDKEIQHAYHTNALLVKILLSQAQVNGLELQVDTTKLENEFLLRAIASSEATALSRPASDFVRRNTHLGKMGGTTVLSMQDPKAAKEKQQLESEAASMKERMQKMQEQTTAFMRERTALNEKIAELQDELKLKDEALSGSDAGQSALLVKLQKDFAALSSEAAGAASMSTGQFNDLQKQLTEHRSMLETARQDAVGSKHQVSELEKQLKQAYDALEGKLAESAQFQQLKNMMQSKSKEVVDLRKKLHKYEPQTIPSADS